LPIFGLIDGNSFYCSCERAFSPVLRTSPVVVLSNNDGCAISRTSEAKALGIKMGDPWHLVRGRPTLGKVEWFSSNYALYGDISRRVFETVCTHVPAAEPYSIDETFIDLSGLPGDLHERCRNLREDVLRVTKIPTCVGWGPSKTIAKLGNAIAKSEKSLGGLCDLTDPSVRAGWYVVTPVSEVWGIGGKTAAKLAKAGIKTIADFVAMDTGAVRDMLTVTGARTHSELRGISCLHFTEMVSPQKGLAVTRSFGRPVTEWHEMREAVSAFAARAAEKLRAAGLEAGHLTVFVQTNPHAENEPWHSGQRAARIEPTSDTIVLIGESIRMLRPLWRDGHRFFKAGVMLNDLADARSQPVMLFSSRNQMKSNAIMGALDAVNARYGSGTLRPLATGIERGWQARHHRRSPRYTTRLDEILIAKAW
jgi:DNA polymerase V